MVCFRMKATCEKYHPATSPSTKADRAAEGCLYHSLQTWVSINKALRATRVPKCPVAEPICNLKRAKGDKARSLSLSRKQTFSFNLHCQSSLPLAYTFHHQTLRSASASTQLSFARAGELASNCRTPVVAMAHSCLHSTSSGATIWASPAVKTVSTLRQASVVRCAATKKGEKVQAEMPRREAMVAMAVGGALSWLPGLANAASLPPGPPAPKICDTDCEKELEGIPTTTTPSGLQFKDIVVGTGDSPPVGFQVAANYVAMIPGGKIFDSSLEKGVPYIFRVGVDQVIKGLDEGILSMKVGGKRRLYIPGELAFPKGLGASAGRPRVPPSSPVVFDVSLLYIPGISDIDTE